jgi:uncharacterized membrane protein YbhN (UPF0104 family)
VHLLDAFAALRRSPGVAVRMVVWMSAAVAAQVLAAAAIASALGVGQPLRAAILVVPVVGLAGLVPLTPGNFGIQSGAVALALHGRGVSGGTALAAGLAYHAVQTAAGVSFGLAGLLLLARFRSPGARRLVLTAAACLAVLALVAGLGSTLGPDAM